jgi:hypothetical protein
VRTRLGETTDKETISVNPEMSLAESLSCAVWTASLGWLIISMVNDFKGVGFVAPSIESSIYSESRRCSDAIKSRTLGSLAS